jgi:hypothetical protein
MSIDSARGSLLGILHGIMCKENGWDFKVIKKTKEGFIIEYFPIKRRV